ncbi:uncharacterized protein LOC144112953 [Amblyomma americanum]
MSKTPSGATAGTTDGQDGGKVSDSISVSDFLSAMREKDRLLASLLERLALPASSGAPGVAAATTTYQVMPDLSKNISDFDGSGDAVSAKEWLGNLQTTATLHRWPEPFKLETAKCHLVGPAKDWLRSRKEVSTSWENFDYHFRRTFCGQTRAAERWRKMQERVQQRNESTTAYFHSKVRLCREANLDFCDTREQVLTGLRSRQLCTMLLGRTHEDDDDLLHDIMEFERIDREREQRFGGMREKRQFTAATERVAETPPARKTTYDRFGKDRRPPLTNERGQFKCYNCGRFGHISCDCPEERHEMKCLRCGKSGHTQRHCSMSQSNETNTVTDTERKIAPGALLKQVMLNGTTTLVGMIDNGSSGCLLRASAAARCGARLTKDATALYGFGSQGTPSARAIGKCYTDLEIDGVKGENGPFLVVPDDTLTVDLLVGRTYTELPYVAYARLGGCLRFWHKSVCPFSHLEPLNEPRLRVKATRETVIHSNSINWITLSSDSDLSGPVLFCTLGSEILVDMREGEISVPIFTSGDKDLLVKRGRRLGRVMEVDVVEIPDSQKQPARVSESDATEPKVFCVATERRPIEDQQLEVGPSVTKQQKAELLGLLNKYRDCFANNISELGCTPVLKMDITETPGSSPVAVRPCRTNAAERETIREIVGEWKREDIVSETSSPYASPVILVQKKNGEKRLVVDYRRLNAQRLKEKYPLPSMDEQLEKLSGAKLYTVLDLAHGYLQVPLSDEANSKTAFITPDETGQFERMTFGLTNAPSVFQRLMNRVLGPLRGTIAMCYLDDVLIPARNWNELLVRLRQVLEAFKRANLTLRLSKCAFAKDSVEFLGFRLKEGTVQPGEAKVQAIELFPVPKNAHDVRRF